MSAGPAIVVVRFSSLGDVVLTTPLLRAIKREYPSATITMVTKLAYGAVFSGNPHVHRLVTLAPGESVGSLAQQVGSARFDHRLDLHGSLRSLLLRHRLGGRWYGVAKRRIRRKLMLWSGRRPATPVPMAERYFEAARIMDVKPDGTRAEVFPSQAGRMRAERLVTGPYVVLAPGARHATKRWPARHWRALASNLSTRGMQVVGLGAPADRAALDGATAIPAFGENLETAIGLLAGAQAAVCNDSGLMHLATAVDTPVVALFGPTAPEFGFGPYRSRHVTLERDLACRPCSVYGGATCPRGHHRCLEEIAPTDVAAALDSVA